MSGLRRGIRIGGLWLALAMAALGLGRVAARAQEPPAAAPLISPEEMLSVDQIRPGMKGYGRSVFEGTKIEEFRITVLGVLQKIDFDGDLILIRIDDGYPVTSGSGVSAGMSGSPIYVDGKLIGALAFAWPFARQPVAGVTPIAQMLENYRPGSAPPRRAAAGDLRPKDGPLALDGRLFARATVVPERGLVPAGARDTLYLAPVATPILVSGMGRPGLAVLQQRFARYGALVAPAPGGEVSLPPAERPKLEPGAAVGVQLLGGDIDATAIGTVTYVRDGHVLAFGHPMFGLGSIEMPMTTAYIHGVIASQEVSFKLGSPVERVGSVSQDRNWSIGGEVGKPARLVEAEYAVADRERGVRREYRVQAAVHRELTPQLLYSSLLSAVASVSPPETGTTRGTIEVWPKGLPPIRRENLFAVSQRRSQLEMLFGDPFSSMPLAELLQILNTLEDNPFGAVPVERIRVAVDVSEKRHTARIERAYADRKRVKPGDRVKIGVVIQPADGEKVVRELEVEIPRNIPGGRVTIGVAGGASAAQVRQYLQIARPPARTLEQLLAQFAERERNNDLTLEIAQPVVGVSAGGREFPNLPNVVVEVLTGANPSGIRMVRTHTQLRQEMPWVLSGAALLSLQVDADEKDKSGPPLAPGGAGAGPFGSLLDLFRISLGGDLGTDSGDLGEGTFDEGDEDSVAARRALWRALVAAAGAGKGAELPNDPPAPTFEELQRILEQGTEGGGAPATEGGAAASPSRALARAPGVWRARTARDFQGGKLEGVLVSSRGRLGLAPEARPLLSSPERFFWAQAADAAGNVYVGGWLDAGILKIDPSGRHAPFFTPPGEVAISALAGDADGALYAAAEPSGTIYRIDASGRGAPLCRLPNHRVWALRKVGDALYAATGSEGKLYRIGSDGQPRLVFTAPDRHILALADDGRGGLYCGTYPRGKVFRLHDGQVTPVYELPNLTVTALACDRQGNLYIGTSPKATIVRLTPAGDASLWFQSAEKHVFSLLADDAGNVYAAVGATGKVYKIAPDRTLQTLWEPQAAYVLSLSRDGSGNLYATTAGPTQVVRLGARPAQSGSYTSPVLNAGHIARWGAIRWNGPAEGVRILTRSGNTAYPDATWSDWSAPESGGSGGVARIGSPPGQYLQYRVVLEAREGAEPPSVGDLELFFRTRNRAPEVTLTAPAAGDLLAGARPIRWSGKDADGDRLTYEVYFQREGTDRWVRIGTRLGPAPTGGSGETEGEELSARPAPAPRFARHAAPATVVGAARLPSTGVSRPAAVRPVRSVRSASAAPAAKPAPKKAAPAPPMPAAQGAPGGAEAETAPADDLSDEGTSLTWDTKKVPDGRYRIRIVASDVATNPDEPATAEVVSEPLRVDNTGPRIDLLTARRAGLAPPVEVPVADAGAYVASAEYRVDGGEWVPAAAADGIFDSPVESIRIDPARLKPGRHTLEVRARDAAGNETTARLIYRLPAPAPPAPRAPSAPPATPGAPPKRSM